MKKTKPLFKLTKNVHLDNLLAKLPMITILYGVQCALMNWYIKDIDIGDYAIYLALTLVTFISSMFCYDKYHHVILCEDCIHIYFEVFRTSKYINYQDIEKIVVPISDLGYGAVTIYEKNENITVLHFIDYPEHVKAFIEKLAKYEPKTDIAA